MIKLIHTDELLNEITRLLIDCPKVSILTAYLSIDGISFAFQTHSTELEVFTSLHNEYVDPKGLEFLLDNKATIYVYTGAHLFHPKVYLFHSSPLVAIVGSSNLTLGGLRDNLELNVCTDEPSITTALLEYVTKLKQNPLFGRFTTEAFSKYKGIEANTKKLISKLPPPRLEDYSELLKLIKFPQAADSQHNILKMKLPSRGQYSRDKWNVVWLTERNTLVGSTWSFFPPADQDFEVRFTFSGHDFPSIRTHITSSRQISGLHNKLSRRGFKLKPGDILCFEEINPKTVYRFWLEAETS